MSDGYIIRRGSSANDLKNAYAIIMVTFPAGAVCTCSNGTKTYTAGNTYGGWAFGVNAAGAWTITITQGAKTRSQTVTVTGQYQVINLKLVFEYVVFADGVLSPDVGNGVFVAGKSDGAYFNVGDQVMLSCDDYYYSYDTGSSYATYKFSGAVDLTDFSVIRVVGRSGHYWGSVESGNAVIGVGTGSSFAESVSVPNAGTSQELSIDISALTGGYNIMLKTETLSYLEAGGGYAQWIDYIAFE